jgi:hypothetical protein
MIGAMGSGPVGCRFELPGEIATAYDVNETAILNLHWVGLVLAGNFLAWKQAPGAGCRFWPKAGVPEAEPRNRACRCPPTQTLLTSEWVQGREEEVRGYTTSPPVLFKRSKGGDRKGDAFRPSVLLRNYFVVATALVQPTTNLSLAANLLSK